MKPRPRAYIETNFLVETVLDQDGASACREILDLARRELITLVVPASAFTEAAETIRRRRRDLAEVQQAAEKKASDVGLRRTAAVRDLRALVERHATEIDERRTVVLKEVLGVVTLIETTPAVIEQMIDITDFKPPDATILAHIRAHLSANGGGPNVVFITSDKKLAEEADLKALGCQASIPSLTEGLRFLTARVVPAA